MSFADNDVVKALEGAAVTAATIAAPGVGGVIATIVTTALNAALDLARAGEDPVIEVKRILSADSMLQRVRAEWQREIDREFGATLRAPTPPDTIPSASASHPDPYEEEP